MAEPLPDDLPASLAQIRTRPLFVMRLDVLPMQLIGDTPGGRRRVGVVPSGRFEGERLAGAVLEGGADWQSVHTDGAVRLDVRLMLRTSDGAMIGMTYQGLRHGPPDTIATLDKGEPVDPRSTPRAITSASPRRSRPRRRRTAGSTVSSPSARGIDAPRDRSTACSKCSDGGAYGLTPHLP